ncbi:MAG TPA: hypothetical protein VFH89_04795 [Sphingomicrobium sp.]|nr:hypothetical protein [Sphingomicrobium sp.]
MCRICDSAKAVAKAANTLAVACIEKGERSATGRRPMSRRLRIAFEIDPSADFHDLLNKLP